MMSYRVLIRREIYRRIKKVKYKNNKILESAIEVRFNQVENFDRLLLLLIKDIDFLDIKDTSIMNLPEDIRKKEANLRFKPWKNIFVKDNIVISVGPSVLSIVNQNKYNGWDLNFEWFCKQFSKIKSSTNKIFRVGVRYVDFFEGLDDFLSYFKLKISSEFSIDKMSLSEKATIQTHLNFDDGCKSNLVLSSEALVLDKKGGLLDFDVYCEDENISSEEEVFKRIDVLHIHSLDVFDKITTENLKKIIS